MVHRVGTVVKVAIVDDESAMQALYGLIVEHRESFLMVEKVSGQPLSVYLCEHCNYYSANLCCWVCGSDIAKLSAVTMTEASSGVTWYGIVDKDGEEFHPRVKYVSFRAAQRAIEDMKVRYCSPRRLKALGQHRQLGAW